MSDKRDSKPQISRAPGSVGAAPLVVANEVLASAYRIEREVACTDTGLVYSASDLYLAREVAVKLGWKDQAAGAVLNEARRCASVKDPGAVAVFAMGTHRGAEYAVAERAATRHLHEVLGNALSPAIYLRWLRQVVASVAAAHDAGVAIGEVSAATVGQTTDGRLVLGRLSLSQVAAFGPAGNELTPEVASGACQLGDPNAAEGYDLYQLGCFAFELATGARPFVGSVDQMRAGHATQAPPTLIGSRPDLPSELGDLVAWLLAKAPANRPRSAQDVLTQLDVVIERERLSLARRWLRVLVVDSDSVQCRWLAGLAKRANPYAVVEAALDGTEAAHKLNRDKPDVVIVSAQLRGVMNALELHLYLQGLRDDFSPQLVVVGTLPLKEQAVFGSSATFVPAGHDAADALLDILRRAASVVTLGARTKRSTISG